MLRKGVNGQGGATDIQTRRIVIPTQEDGEGSHSGGDGGCYVRATDCGFPWLIFLTKFPGLAIVLAALAIIIGLAAGLTARKKKQEAQKTPTGSSAPSNSSLSSIAPSSIPQSVRGTYLDPFTWVDTTDFNLTYTPVTFGNLSVMGLNDSYSDAARPNPSIPPLNQPFPYAHTPIRGVNLGGWLSTEPFITPSLFSSVSITPSIHAIVDEYTLSLALGTTLAGQHLENHYASFVRRETFSAIRAAGFDHVRFNFPYWAVQTYDGDPYVPHTCWRYLLRGIEWARAEGLRVCLDLHSAPGSQNGNDHSGRRGGIGWLDGTPQGQLNADRTLQIHNQLAAFFGQERYRNVITIYGVLNEPRMVDLDTDVVLNWTSVAIAQLRASPLPDDTILVISDGFLPLTTWHTALPALRLQNANPSDARILLDAHQYVIFNTAQLALNHSAKLDFACQGWNQQTTASMDPTTGFGNFLCGEWSQADTDCAAAVNGVGIGSRWAGTLDTGNASTSVLTPSCPPGGACDCGGANADPSGYGRGYQEWLKKFAEAQVRSFEVGWGWFYWTWDTEGGDGTSQWSWRRGVEAGILPSDVSTGGRGVFWDCGGGGYGEDWEAMGLGEAY